MHRLKTALLLAALFLLSGCSLYESVPLHDIYWSIRAHDTVRITTQDGKQIEFAVTAVADEEIVGKQDRVAFEEIELLERKPRYDPWHVLSTIGVLVTWLILA